MELPAQLLLQHQQGVATRAQLLAYGMTWRGLTAAVADGRLTRVGRGLYRDRPLPARGEHLLSAGSPDPGYVAEVREAQLRLGSTARAARGTAAVLWAIDMQVEPAGISLDVAHGRGAAPVDGVEVRESRRGGSVLWCPVPGTAPLAVTPAAETAVACAAELPLAQAVAVVDSALRRSLVTRPRLLDELARHQGAERRAHLRQVLPWCDARCGSLLESLLRVLLCEAGLPPPRTQHVLVDPRTGVASRVDFAWPGRRLVVEADGRRWHDPADARDRDRRRDNTCATLGWRVLRFAWADVVHEPQAVVATVGAALAA